MYRKELKSERKNDMNITVYGATVVSSEDDIMTNGKDGKVVWVSSLTEISVKEDDVVNFAVEKLHEIFNGFEFENNTDYNDMTPEKLEQDIRDGHNICIQGCDSHVNIEFFTRELSVD